MSKSTFLNENQPLVSEAEKYPQVFAWKTGALVLMGLIVVMLIVDISMYIYLNNHPVPLNNLTFANDIVLKSQIITQGSTIRILMANMILANSDISYQFSELLTSGTGSQFRSETIKEQIFRKRDHNLFFIFKVRSGVETHVFGLYSTAEFPVPDADEFRKDIEYFTFSSGDNRKSVLLSLEKQGNFLKANSSNKDVESDPRICKEYTLREDANRFSMLNVLQVTLDQNPDIAYTNAPQAYKCFDKIKSAEQLIGAIEDITGCDFANEVIIEAFEVFYMQD